MQTTGQKDSGGEQRSGGDTAPTLSLPKGGGAIRGIGDKFGDIAEFNEAGAKLDTLT